MTGFAKGTVLKFLAEIGNVCAEYQNEKFQNLNSQRLQLDEIWSFCGSKEKNVPMERRGEHGAGDVWTWTAIDADTKLMPCWYVGKRFADDAYTFIRDLSARIANSPQLTTDGLRMYVNAIGESFGRDVAYAQLVKVYGMSPFEAQNRYSPSGLTAIEKKVVSGNPDPKHVSTSYVERANLTMRMGMRRFTRLTNAFSKKIENHEAAIALHFMHYNFCRVHQTLRVTPAMEAKLSDHVWSLGEVVALLEAGEMAAIERGEMKRGSYRPKNKNSN